MSITCDKCGKANRDIARYCKYCGKPVLSESSSLLEKLVGLGAVKEDIKSLVEFTKAVKKRQKSGGNRINMHTIIMGNTGTGKTTLAQILQQLYLGNEIISKAHPMVVDAPDYDNWLEEFEDNIDKAKGGILFIDNAQKLLPGGYASDVNKLDKLFSGMDRFKTDPIVILAGLPGGFREFLAANPSIRSRFEYRFDLPDYSYTELSEICFRMLREVHQLEPSEECKQALTSIFKKKWKERDESFGNAHVAVDMAEDIFKKYIKRISKGGQDDSIVSTKDIPCPIPEEKSLEEVMKDLDDFIGMEEIKTAVKDIARQVQTNQERAARGYGEDEKPGVHIILTGNPGTGKTTIARKLGEIFAAIGFLDSGHVVEVDRSKLVGQYQGQTAQLVTDACDKAMGGILFVDEAYTLAPVSDSGSKDKYGTEAVETLMKRIEDDRDKFVVIAAGYQNEMDQFIRVNPGIDSRFNKKLHIDDYKPDELFAIYKIFIKKKKYRLHPEAEELAKKAIGELYEMRDANFGNGREMRGLFETTSGKFADRISKLPKEEQTDEALVTIMPADIPYEEQKDIDPEECMAKLNELTGLHAVKREVRGLIDMLNLQKQRGDDSKPELKSHFVFSGNPGTGKTTVARIVADIFKAMGVLSRGHLIEADRSALVAGLLGQTAIKTNNIIDKAMGGVLFIDEAYTLNQGDRDEFGQEAIDALLKRMEDDRGKFIVIAAGYTHEMEEFLKTNPGLPSRFNRKIAFEDFAPDALEKVFRGLLNKNNYTLTKEADENLTLFIQGIFNRRDENFGNAREMRKIFEEAQQRQSVRLTQMITEGKAVPPEELSTLNREDIEGEVEESRSLEDILAELDDFIGMDSVKKAVREIAAKAQLQQYRIQKGMAAGELEGQNIVLTGNPGTGKTTVARKLGEIFKSIGIIDRGHVIEVDRSQLVGQYQGETPKLVNDACNRALGGILFIDEAYTLAPVSDSGQKDKLGTEALETLLKRMEDDRGRYIVIAAGYQQPMEQLFSVNSGMKSRFDRFIHIEDYKPDELLAIFKIFVKKKKYKLHPDAEEKLKKAIQLIFDTRDKNFANAREMRKLFDNTVSQMSNRISSLEVESLSDDDFVSIVAEDIPYEEKQDLDPEACMAKLNKLSGLDGVKKEVRSIIDLLNLQKQRGDEGARELKSHFVFSGNPGTGKTTVARIMADIFKAMGVLSRGHLIEADRSELVAGVVGQTSIKTNNLVDKAMGGVLFIDEAYTLSQGDRDEFGQEAIDTLLKRMEDDRGKFIVIAAGYTNEMEEFLKTNPGLPSRFNRKIEFDDYKAEALETIFRGLLKKNNYKLDAEADENIRIFIEGIYNRRDKNFGNAREMRRLYEEALQRQSSRLTKMMSEGAEIDPEELSLLTRPDIEGEVEKARPLNEILSELDDFIGMDTVKKAVREVAAQAQLQQIRIQKGMAAGEHAGINIVLTGNPGTGKTTIARKLGEVFKSIGILSRGHVVEVDRSQLIGQFQGETPKLVNKAVDNALGGILFVDEAYALAPPGNQPDKYGQEAIETLMKRIEDDHGKFIFIAAGYQKEMENFLNANPGMQSRIDRFLHIDDYNADELYGIFNIFVKKKKFRVTEEAEDKIKKAIRGIYDARDRNFANAREMRKLFDQAQSALSSRLTNTGVDGIRDEDLVTIIADDIPETAQKEEAKSSLIDPVEKLIGREEVKAQVRPMARLLEMTKMRTEKFGIEPKDFTHHFAFLAHGGSGKSTTAQALAEMFAQAKALPSSRLSEVDMKNILNGPEPQAQLMRLIDRADGGSFMLDHFDLLTESTEEIKQGISDLLVQRINSSEHKFCLIIAGDAEPMEKLLSEEPFNELAAKIPQRIKWDGFGAADLFELLNLHCESNNFRLADDAREGIKNYFESHREKGAHEVKALFEQMLQNQMTRLTPIFGTADFDEDMMNELKTEDLP